MDISNSEGTYLKIIEKIRIELKQIELISADYSIKERVQKLLELIEQETSDNKEILAELIKEKIKETRGMNSELNINFYLLYRKLVENQVTLQEAKSFYEMYNKELGNV